MSSDFGGYRAGLAPTFAEDKIVVEAQQATANKRPDAHFVMIASDGGMVHARRIVQAMLNAESDTAATAPANKAHTVAA